MVGAEPKNSIDKDELVIVLRRAQKKLNRQNRRKGPDFWVRALTIFGFGGWALLFFAFVIFDLARPETQTIFHNVFGRPPKRGWNENLKDLFFYIMILCQFVSIVGIWVNSLRMRRKSDKYRWNLVGLSFFSFLALLLFYWFNN